MRKRVLLAAVGDVNDIRTWSGTPFHFLQVARSIGLIHEGLALEPIYRHRQLRRYLWNLAAVLRGRGHGGYQFSAASLELLWQPQRQALAGTRVINCFQLFPDSLVADDSVERWYYIDQTLRQFFDDYGLHSTLSGWMAKDIFARERQGYLRATGIVAHSHWAAQSVIRDYGIAADKVHVVVPGANLDSDGYVQWAAARPPPLASSATLKLVFVGKAPERKGLGRLIRALQLARRAGADCCLRILGCEPESLPPELRGVDGVEWLGFIHKRKELHKFMDVVASCDIGCLLSRAEAGGIALREYHALGLAVIGPDVGGSPDHVIREAAHLVAPDASDESIATLLLHLSQHRHEVQRMREISWARRTEVSWTTTVSRWTELLA